MSNSNKIYIVAGERNMLLARAGGGGLYANVGQTTREVSERLRDDDYKRKAAGGKWQVLLTQEVGEVVTDKQIHQVLRRHPSVSWDPDCDNTEEFLFKDDTGDGQVACRIVGEILQQVCLPLLQAEVARLREVAARMDGELEERAQIIRGLASGEIVQEAMRRLEKSEDHTTHLEGEITRLNDSIQAETAKNEKLKEELDYVRTRAGEHLERIRGMNDVSKQLQQSEDARRVLEFKLELLGAAAIVALLVVAGVGWWKISAAQEETRLVESELRETQATLRTATLKNDRLALKVLDLADAGPIDRGRPPAKSKRPLTLDEGRRLDREQYLAYDKTIYYNNGSYTSDFALKHSSPSPDVNADMENVKVLDSGVLTLLINDQVIPAATGCLLKSPDISGKFFLTSSVGILPDGSVGHLRTLASRGSPSAVEECIVPAVRGARIEAPGINLLGTYTVEISIERDQ